MALTKGHFGHHGEKGQVLKHPPHPPLHVPGGEDGTTWSRWRLCNSAGIYQQTDELCEFWLRFWRQQNVKHVMTHEKVAESTS